MINYIADRKLRHAKSHFDVMRFAVHASGCTILYFIRPHIFFIVLVCFLFIMMLVTLLYHNHAIYATFIAICFLPPRRVAVTTVKGSLVLLDELKLLVSKVGSL